MSAINTYQTHFYEFLDRAGANVEALPASLQKLVDKFEKAKSAWEQDTTAIQKQLLPVLVHTDAVIAAQIYQLYKDRLETEKVDKVKLMALKAKALQLKWKLNKS